MKITKQIVAICIRVLNLKLCENLHALRKCNDETYFYVNMRKNEKNIFHFHEENLKKIGSSSPPGGYLVDDLLPAHSLTFWLEEQFRQHASVAASADFNYLCTLKFLSVVE